MGRKRKYPGNAKERARASSRAWGRANRATNPDKLHAEERAYYERNAEKLRAVKRAWRRANPDKARVKGAAWRARKRGLTPILSLEERASIFAIYAKARAMTELSGEPYHVDHIKPLVKGGLHHPDNLQVLRGVDNIRKGGTWTDRPTGL